MKIEPTDYEWRSIRTTVGEEVVVPYGRRATTIIPTASDPDRVTVTYLTENLEFDPDEEPYSPNGGELQAVNKWEVTADESVPLNHFHHEVTLYPASDGDSLTAYFLGPVPLESEELYTPSGEMRIRKREYYSSR